MRRVGDGRESLKKMNAPTRTKCLNPALVVANQNETTKKRTFSALSLSCPLFFFYDNVHSCWILGDRLPPAEKRPNSAFEPTSLTKVRFARRVIRNRKRFATVISGKTNNPKRLVLLWQTIKTNCLTVPSIYELIEC